MKRETVGAVLIGGTSRRMGADKAHVELRGVPMVTWVVAALQEAGMEVITVGSPDRIAGYPNVPDSQDFEGPLAGLHAALMHAAGRSVFLSAVDQPLIRSATVRCIEMVESHDAVVPYDQGWPQVTCALYRNTCLATLERLARTERGASIRDLLANSEVYKVEKAEWSGWEENGTSWLSLDSPESVRAAEFEHTS